MTTYSFSPANTNDTQNWDSASIWSPEIVPNGSAAVVEFPEIFNTAPGQKAIFMVQILSGESYAVSAIDAGYETIYNQGSLTVLHEMTIGAGGGLYNFQGTPVYSFGSLENDGLMYTGGQMSVAGTVVNRGVIDSGLTLTAARFENIGTLYGFGGALTISLSDGDSGFVNLSGGTLTGGTYEVGAGQVIDINVKGPITTLAANYQYLGAGGALQTYDAGGTSYVAVQSSLTTIAASGLLGIENDYTNTNALTVQGQIVINGGSFIAPSLTVAVGGSVSGSAFGAVSTITAAGGIVDNGSILAIVNSETVGFNDYENSTLLVSGPVTGNGVLVVGAGHVYYDSIVDLNKTATVMLELGAADSATVLFADATGTLQLDAPKTFTGTIESFAAGDSIVLSGISLSSETYAGDSTHGVLTLVTSGGIINLAFDGNYTTSSFAFAAGAQPLSTSPPSIVITDNAGGQTPNWTAATAITAQQAGTLASHSVVVDSAANVAAQIDGLQALVAAGNLGSVVLSDLDSPVGPVQPPAMTITASQFLSDAGVLAVVDSAYTLNVTGATVAQAESIAGGSHVALVTVVDSIADIAAQIDQLGTLAATGQVTSIAGTDAGFAGIAVTSTQFNTDHTAFDVMSGSFTVDVSAAAANASVEGVAGHGVTVVFSGTAGEYSLTAQGDGIGLTVTDTGTGRTSVDSLRGITAVQFSDFTDIVAQAPGTGEAGSVTTGNVTELYGAVFGRLPDVPGLAYYQAEAAANPNLPLTHFAQQFLASPEYINNPAHTYAQSSAGDASFITDCYQNLLHRGPETGAVAYYQTIINTFTAGLTAGTAAYAAAQTLGHAYVLTDFSASQEFLNDVQVTAANPSSAQHWLILV